MLYIHAQQREACGSEKKMVHAFQKEDSGEYRYECECELGLQTLLAKDDEKHSIDDKSKNREQWKQHEGGCVSVRMGTVTEIGEAVGSRTHIYKLAE